MATYGDPLGGDYGNGLTHTFPKPDKLVAAGPLGLGMPAARVTALSSLAAAVAADPRLLGPSQSLEIAVSKLRALRGIGEWTAQYIAMRAMREPDAFPAADIGLLRALTRPDGSRPSAAELLAMAENWRPWRAYAAQHLWSAGPVAKEKSNAPAIAA